jgi:hypothetical protein
MLIRKMSLLLFTATLSTVGRVTAVPPLQFANGTNTGFSSPSQNTLSLDAQGNECMNIDSTDVTVTATLVALAPCYLTNLFCRQSVQVYAPTVTPSDIQINQGISVLFIDTTGAYTVNVYLPDNPIDGQLITIMTNSTNTITLTYLAGAGGAGVYYTTSVDSIDANASLTSYYGGASVTYLYTSARNDWIRIYRG